MRIRWLPWLTVGRWFSLLRDEAALCRDEEELARWWKIEDAAMFFLDEEWEFHMREKKVVIS